MHFLVTGGAGYIGSTLVRELVGAGHAVTVLDNLCAGHREAVPPVADLVVADLRHREEVLTAVNGRGFDGVFHFAAFASVGDSMKSPEDYFRNNVVGSLNLLEAVMQAKVPRLVFSSTCAVYGVPESVPIREGCPRNPSNPYGASKKFVEDALEWAARIHGLKVACLRYFNAAGATGPWGEDHTPETHLIPLVLQVALGQRERVEVLGDDYPTPDGTCIRDYVHVRDLARAHVLAFDALAEQPWIVCNLGAEKGASVFEVIECARAVTGHPIPAVAAPRRPGDPPVLVADSSQAWRELGWRAEASDLHEIVSSAWEWHRTHPYGYAGELVPPTLASKGGR